MNRTATLTPKAPLLMLAAAIGIELIERSEADHTPIGSHMRR